MFQYTKYIIWRLASPTLLICLSLTGIAWLTQSLKFLDLIVNRGLDIGTFLYLSSLILPSLLWVIIPISLFISVLYVYGKLVADSELVVLRSAGISKLGQIKPAIIFSLLVTLISYIVSFYLLPASTREFKDMQSFIRDNYASILLQEGVFTSPTNGLTVYIRERTNNGLLSGILIHDVRTKGKIITMMAEEGKLVKSTSGPRFILSNGNRQEIDNKDRQLSLLYFERYALELDIFQKNAAYNRWREPQERYLNDLFNPTDHTKDPRLLQKLRAEGHHRITWPLYNIFLTLLALIVFVTGEFNRRGSIQKIVAVISSGIGIVIVALALNNMVAKNISITPAIYSFVILGIFITFYFLIKDPVMKSEIGEK